MLVPDELTRIILTYAPVYEVVAVLARSTATTIFISRRELPIVLFHHAQKKEERTKT
jgi:hypothetical protein